LFSHDFIVPLGTPLLAGPEVISAVIVHASKGPTGQGNTVIDYLLLSAIMAVALRAAGPLNRILGKIGIEVSTLLTNLNLTLSTARGTLENTSTTLTTATSTLSTANGLMRPGPDQMEDVHETLEEFRRAARSVRVLADYLEATFNPATFAENWRTHEDYPAYIIPVNRGVAYMDGLVWWKAGESNERR
jgi:MarC family integral membrane protein